MQKRHGVANMSCAVKRGQQGPKGSKALTFYASGQAEKTTLEPTQTISSQVAVECDGQGSTPQSTEPTAQMVELRAVGNNELGQHFHRAEPWPHQGTLPAPEWGA